MYIINHATSCDGATNWCNTGSPNIFFAIFPTKRTLMAEERLHNEHQQNMQHDRLLIEISEHLHSLEHLRSRAL